MNPQDVMSWKDLAARFNVTRVLYAGNTLICDVEGRVLVDLGSGKFAWKARAFGIFTARGDDPQADQYARRLATVAGAHWRENEAGRQLPTVTPSTPHTPAPPDPNHPFLEYRNAKRAAARAAQNMENFPSFEEWQQGRRPGRW